MIVLLLLAAVAAAAYWAGTQSRRYPRGDVSRQLTSRGGADREIRRGVPTPYRTSAPTWPWVLGMVVIAALILGFVSGPGGVFGPGALFAPVFGP